MKLIFLLGVWLVWGGFALGVVSIQVGERKAELLEVEVECELVGEFLVKEMELTFRYEGSERMAEGELVFPIEKGERIVGYAMDVNGKRREGVVVPRERARVAYQEIVDRKVDPGILEVDEEKGEFRTRVYPLMPKENKRVWVTTMRKVEAGKVSVWPEGFDCDGGWSFELEVKGEAGAKAVNEKGTGVMPKVVVDWKPTENLGYQWEGYGFRFEDGVRRDFEGKVAELWVDGSVDLGPSAFRNLEVFVKWVNEGEVVLRVFRGELSEGETFQVSGGKSEELRKAIGEISRRGMARVGTLDWTGVKADVLGVLTDGDFVEGKMGVVKPGCPMVVIDAGGGGTEWLERVAVASGGARIAEGEMGVMIEGEVKGYDSMKMMGEKVALAGEVKVSGRRVMTSRVAYWMWGWLRSEGLLTEGVEGRKWEEFCYRHRVMNERMAWLVLETGRDYAQYGFEPPKEEALVKGWEKALEREKGLEKYEMERLVKAWGNRCEELSVEVKPVEERVREDLREALKRWGEVVDEPKKMLPLAEIFGKVNALAKDGIEGGEGKELMVLLGGFDEEVEKLRQEFTMFDVTVGGQVKRAGRYRLMKGEGIWHAVNAAGGATPFGAMNRVKLYRGGKVRVFDLRRDADKDFKLYHWDVVEVPERNWRGNGGGEPGQKGPGAIPEGVSIEVKIGEWDPELGYVTAIDEALKEKGDWWKIYGVMREVFGWRADFYLDVAELLEKREMKGEALEVLGELAELDPGNAELLRKAGKGFLRLGEMEVAELIFRRVLVMQPDELGSYYDLGRSLARAGKDEEAVKVFWAGVLTKRGSDQSRKIVLLEEMNALIAKAGLDGKGLGIDERFLKHVPVELRVMVDWDAEQSNLDLVVFSPSGNWLKGPMSGEGDGVYHSGNVAVAYGPESVSVKQGMPGKYRVEGRFYGDWREGKTSRVTAEAEVIRGFGTKGETRERVAFRIGEKDTIEMMEVVLTPEGWGE